MYTVFKNFFGWLGVVWGSVGVTALLLGACWRLGHYAAEGLQMPLTWVHWLFLVPWMVFMCYGEGYKGFQKAFSPRVAARLKVVQQQPTLWRVVLAPFFAMAFFGAPKRRRMVTYILFATMFCLVLIVRQTPQPWRGLIDVGVVSGLAWGWLCWAVFMLKAFSKRGLAFNAQVE